MATVTIRPVEPADFTAWLPLCEAYQDFYNVTFPDAVTREVFARFFRDDEPSEAAVAVVDGELVGYVTLIFHRTTWSTQDFCYLEDLYVDPAGRRQGVGEALIDWAKSRANARDCARLYWHTQHFNARARSLYDRVAELAPSRVYIKAL